MARLITAVECVAAPALCAGVLAIVQSWRAGKHKATSQALARALSLHASAESARDERVTSAGTLCIGEERIAVTSISLEQSAVVITALREGPCAAVRGSVRVLASDGTQIAQERSIRYVPALAANERGALSWRFMIAAVTPA